jgi:hypothetical protein
MILASGIDWMSSRIEFCALAIELEKKRGSMDRELVDKEDTQFGELGQGSSLPFMISLSDSAPGVQAQVPATRSKMPGKLTVRANGSTPWHSTGALSSSLINLARPRILY